MERTDNFALEILKILKTVPKNIITIPIIDQLVRSGTSIGANYCEANNAVSRKDFINKIGIIKKEAQETFYWLKLLSIAWPEGMVSLLRIKQESFELILIFNSIFYKSREKLKEDINNNIH